VWLLRHIKVNGQRRTVTSLSHAAMAGGMPQALGAKKALPDRQVISLSGDGGLSMLLGDLLTVVQENIPIKVVVFNNGLLGFVDLEMKADARRTPARPASHPDGARRRRLLQRPRLSSARRPARCDRRWRTTPLMRKPLTLTAAERRAASDKRH
jgi:hypothetical protein